MKLEMVKGMDIKTVENKIAEMNTYYSMNSDEYRVVKNMYEMLYVLKSTYPHKNEIKEKRLYDNCNLMYKKYEGRRGIEKLISSINPTYVVTLTSLHNYNEKLFIANCNHLLREINRRIFGKINKKLLQEQHKHIDGLAIVEYGAIKSNIHTHLLIKGHDRYGDTGFILKEKFIKSAERFNKMKRIELFNMEKGFDFKKIYESKGLNEYLSKEVDKDNSNFAFFDLKGISGYVEKYKRIS